MEGPHRTTSEGIPPVCNLISEGAIAKACQAVTSHGVWDIENEHILRKLQELHPHEAAPRLSLGQAEVSSLKKRRKKTAWSG